MIPMKSYTAARLEQFLVQSRQNPNNIIASCSAAHNARIFIYRLQELADDKRHALNALDLYTCHIIAYVIKIVQWRFISKSSSLMESQRACLFFRSNQLALQVLLFILDIFFLEKQKLEMALQFLEAHVQILSGR